jgi:hypothetical protein
VGSFWRPYYQYDSAMSSTSLPLAMNTLWAQLVRGSDRPDLILMDANAWASYLQGLLANQRFTQAETGQIGFPSLKYQDCDVVLDGGIGGQCPANTVFMLNTKYLKFRPHAERNFVPLSPKTRESINQDASVTILAFAGNLTCGGRQFQGRVGKV